MSKLKKIFIASIIMLIPTFSLAEDKPQNIIESPWLSQSSLDQFFNRSKENRFMPFKVIGKNENNILSYKGFFTPYPKNLDRFYVYWGMTDRWYKARKKELEHYGFKEIWHQTFLDSIKLEIHQAVWFRELKTKPDNEKTKDKIESIKI